MLTAFGLDYQASTRRQIIQT